MISVIVADDHAVVRTGLQFIFRDSGVINIKAEAENGSELLSILKNDAFDVVVLDVNMPGVNSIDLVQIVKQLYPHLAIVIFTMNSDEQLAARMFKNGALAYINKEENPKELVEAVKCAYDKKRYLTKRQEYSFANQYIMGNEKIVYHESLSDREYQVMCLLASGKSKTEISEKLMISKNTLSNHRNSILKKLNLSNNVELTKYALHHHLIQ